MKQLEHKMNDTSILIYKHNNTMLRGSFFLQKPEVGDIITSHTFERSLEVIEIVENRDAKAKKEFIYDPADAYFVLKVRKI